MAQTPSGLFYQPVVAFPGKLSVKSDAIKTAPVTKVSDVAPLIAIKNILWCIFHAQMGEEMGFIP